jgi:hypothetical protein
MSAPVAPSVSRTCSSVSCISVDTEMTTLRRPSSVAPTLVM